eukprot:RCo050906
MEIPAAQSSARAPPFSPVPSVERHRVTVAAPATSANLGCGYDCLGMALDIWNELTIERSEKFMIEIHGEGADSLPRDETNLVVTGVKAAFKAAGKHVPPLRYILRNSIPSSSGLGSSSAAIVSGLVAGLVLSGHEMPVSGEESVLQLAAAIEGHPDNVAPALYGGLQIEVHEGSRWYTDRVSLPVGLQCIVFLPARRAAGEKTKAARSILPEMVSRKDAVFNISHAALLINAFSTGNLDVLKIATQDKLHQPQRAALNPHLFPLIEAAVQAGAHGACLSGAGPSVMAFSSGLKGDIYTQRRCERVDAKIAQAMQRAARDIGVEGQVYLTSPTQKGCHVVQAEPPFSAGPSVVSFTGASSAPPTLVL